MKKKYLLDALINIKIEMRERYGSECDAAAALTIAHQLVCCYYHVGEEKPKKGKKPIKAQDVPPGGPIAPVGVPIDVGDGCTVMNVGNSKVLTPEEFMEKGGKAGMLEEPWMRRK